MPPPNQRFGGEFGPSVDDAGPEQVVLVVDFGAQYAQLIARRVREAHVYSRDRSAHDHRGGARSPGTPRASSSAEVPRRSTSTGAPSIDTGIYDTGVPILGICYGAQLVARDLDGEVAKTGRGEYGGTELRHRRRRGCCSASTCLLTSRCG